MNKTIKVVPNGVNTSQFKVMNREKQKTWVAHTFGVDLSPDLNIINTGRLSHEKGISYLIEALEYLPPTTRGCFLSGMECRSKGAQAVYMSNVGIFLPKIDGIGGVERVAYILARDLGVNIYTTYARDDLDLHFPGISAHIVNISENTDKSSLFTLIRDFRSLQDAVDLMIYRYPRSIYLSAVRRDIPYLYYMGGVPHHFYLTAREHGRAIYRKDLF